VKRSVNNARRDRIEADVLLRILRSQATCDGLQTAFVIIGRDTGKPPMGFSTSDDVMPQRFRPTSERASA